MRKFLTILSLSLILLFPTQRAIADSEAAKQLIGGVIGFGLQQIEHEIQSKKAESVTLRGSDAAGGNSGSIENNPAYRGALELGLYEENANYFISPQFQNEVNRGLEIASQSISSDAKRSLIGLDVRGLQLMSNYQEALIFAKKEESVCQSILSNFHSLWHVLNFGRSSANHLIQADSETKISQSAMYCNKGTVRYLSFTPLGRLNTITISFSSHENKTEIFKTFEEKLPEKAIQLKCQRRNRNQCEAGFYFFEDDFAKIALHFEDKKTFKDGKYLYTYEMELSSDYLMRLDNNIMKQLLMDDKPKEKTKL